MELLFAKIETIFDDREGCEFVYSEALKSLSTKNGLPSLIKLLDLHESLVHSLIASEDQEDNVPELRAYAANKVVPLNPRRDTNNTAPETVPKDSPILSSNNSSPTGPPKKEPENETDLDAVVPEKQIAPQIPVAESDEEDDADQGILGNWEDGNISDHSVQDDSDDNESKSQASSIGPVIERVPSSDLEFEFDDDSEHTTRAAQPLQSGYHNMYQITPEEETAIHLRDDTKYHPFTRVTADRNHASRSKNE